MAVYTLSFKELYDLTDSRKTWEERVEETGNNLFNFSFPWYNDNADNSLDLFKKMFVENHFTDEIGFETLGLFKMKMQSVFYEKIPYYTDLYKALHIEYDPLLNSDMHRIDDGTNNTNTNGTDNTKGKDTYNGTDNGTYKDDSVTTISREDTHNESGYQTSNETGQTDSTYKETTSHTGTDSTKATNTGTTSGTSTTKNTNDNNTQTLTSDFPQANFSTKKDYAKNLERGEEKGTSTIEGSESGKSSGDSTGTTTYNTKDEKTGERHDSTINTVAQNHFANQGGYKQQDKNVLYASGNTTRTLFHTDENSVSRETSNDSKNATHNEGRNYGWMGGSKTDELEKYRKSIRNLNEMLLREFDDLFMVVYEPYDGRTWISPIERGLLS